MTRFCGSFFIQINFQTETWNPIFDIKGGLYVVKNSRVSIRPATSLPGFIRRIALFNKTNAYGISKAGKDVFAR